MLLKAVLLALVVGWLWLLYRNDRDRTRLLLVAAVAAGLLLLILLPPFGQLVSRLGTPMVLVAQLAGWLLGPLGLLVALCWVVWKLLRGLWWHWPQRSTPARWGALLGSVVLGLLVAVLIRALPLLTSFGEVAEHSTTVGLRAVRAVALDALTAVLLPAPPGPPFPP